MIEPEERADHIDGHEAPSGQGPVGASVDSPDLLALIGAASEAFEAGRYQSVFDDLGQLGSDGGPVGQALLQASHGLVLEAAGRIAEALDRMEQAMALDVPIPALLRESAYFFQRHGRSEQAHHAFLALDVVAPRAAPRLGEVIAWREGGRYAALFHRRFVRDGRQLTYRMAPFKSALVKHVGPEAAAITLATFEDGEAPRRAARRPLVPLIEHARRWGREYHEVIPSEPVQSHPPRVHGRPAAIAFEKRSRTLFTCVLDEVVVRSHSNVLLVSEAALLDVQGDELSRDPDLGVDPTVVARDGGDVLVTEPRDPHGIRQLAEAIWLSGVHSRGFGHLMAEFLPKLWALMERPGFERVPILVDDDMPPQHTEAIRFFAGDGHPLIVLGAQEYVRVASLWVASQLVYLAVGPRPKRPRSRGGRALHPTGFLRLMERPRAACEDLDTTGLPARVYLKRKPTQHRRLSDAAAIEAMLTERGFAAYDFGDLAFREQLRLIRAADHVVAQDGSAMLMTIFGRRGLRLSGLAQPNLDEWEWYADASRALGHELTVILGSLVQQHPSYAWMSDYRIDPAELAAYLDGLDGRPAALPIDPSAAGVGDGTQAG